MHEYVCCVVVVASNHNHTSLKKNLYTLLLLHSTHRRGLSSFFFLVLAVYVFFLILFMVNTNYIHLCVYVWVCVCDHIYTHRTKQNTEPEQHWHIKRASNKIISASQPRTIHNTKARLRFSMQWRRKKNVFSSA